jgi:hypothetical protein
MYNFKRHNLLKKFLFQLICILIFIGPFIFYGPNDIEEYELNLNSARIIWNWENNPFITFFDFYGPGVKFPIGQGPILHFANFFFFNLKIFYLIFIFFQIFVQLYFFKKILRKLQINFNEHILIVLMIFSAPHLHFVYSEDVMSMFFGFTFFPVVFYYCIKFIKDTSVIHTLKLSLFFFIWFINSHTGHIIIFIIFLIFFYLLFAKKKTDFLRKNNFLLIILIFFLLGEYVFFLLREKYLFDIYWKSFTRPYALKNFIENFFLTFNNWTDARGPGNPILFWFSLIVIIINTVKFLNNYINSKKKITFTDDFKLNFLFFLFVVISLTKIIVVTRIASGPNIARDVFFYISIIIFFKNFNRVKKKLARYFIVFLLLAYTFNLFFINIALLRSNNNINLLRSNNSNNFVINKIQSSDLIKTLKGLSLKKNDYSRIYLSPKVFSNRFNFTEEGIFSTTDLIQYNLSPFQGAFKNISLEAFKDQDRLMYGKILSHFKYINSNLFMDIFYIKYLLIFEDELSALDNLNWILVKRIEISNNKFLHLFKRDTKNLAVNNVNKFISSFDSCMVILDHPVDCLLKNKDFFYTANHKIVRIKNSFFEILDANNQLIVLPFLFDSNWRPNPDIIEVGKFFMLYNSSSNASTLYYFDYIRFSLRLISYLASFFIILVIFINNKKCKFYINNFKLWLIKSIAK